MFHVSVCCAPRSCPPPVGASGPCRAVPHALEEGVVGSPWTPRHVLLGRARVFYLFFRHLASWRILEFVLGFLRRRLRWLPVCCWPGAAPSSGATTASVDSSTSCTAAAASSSAAPALPVGRATLLSAGSGSRSLSAGRERLGSIGSLRGVSTGSFERCGARLRDKVPLSGCWVSCCRVRLRRFWFTISVHVTVAFELSPAVCPPSGGIQSAY